MNRQNNPVSDRNQRRFINIAVVSLIFLSAFIFMLTAGFLAFRFTNSDKELAKQSGKANIIQLTPSLASVNQDSLESPQ